MMRHQLAPYILAIIAVFLVVCYLISDSTGFVGGFLKSAMFGLFGNAAWAIPFLLLNIGVFWKRDVATGALGYKCTFSFLCTCFVSVLLQAAARSGEGAVSETFNVVELYKAGAEHIGGGVFGGLLGNLLLRGFGFAGTLILGIALILLFGIFLFGMTPHMFAMYILTGLREWKDGLDSQMEQGRIEREQMRLAIEQRRHEERAAALRIRQEQLALRRQQEAAAAAEAAAARPSRRHVNDAFNEEIMSQYTSPVEEEPLDLSDCPAGQSRSPVGEPVQEDSPVQTPPPAAEPIDAAVFDEVMRREREKTERRTAAVQPEPAPEPETDIVESDAPPFDTEEEPTEKPEKQPLNLSFFRKEKVKPLPKTGAQQLTELEQDENIDLAKIFTEPEEETVIPEPAVVDDEENEIVTSAEIDLMVEKSRLEGPPMPAVDEDEDDDEPSPSPQPAPAPAQPVTEAVKPQPISDYVFPPIPLLSMNTDTASVDLSGEIQQTATKLVETLRSFNVKTKIINVSRGPTITRYELQPEVGTKVRSILNLVDDIALHLATSGVRIEAPIPGKEAVGIEVPNKTISTVYIRELIEDPAFKASQSKVTTSLGMDVAGNPVYLDVAKMPHLLIAGTTGSGKSVCINSLIISILYKARPDEVKFIMIDPKKVELNVYNGIPHLLVPVVSDPKKAAGSLHWAVTEMERRYELIEGAGVRNLKGYNNSIANDPTAEKLPQIVIVIDELADLMMTTKDDVEESICRIAQKARAAGMYLILGTQRPSVDVVTGLIKANVPSRIAFTTANQVDSRTIIDVVGAEKLIGRGDMLYAPIGSVKPTRVQGCFVSDDEVEAVTTFIKQNYGVKDYDQSVMDTIEREAQLCGNKKATALGDGDEEANDGDPMLKPAIQLAVESGKISTSLIQRRLQLGYGRAAKLIDAMEQMGIVGPPQGQKPRDVLISKQEYMEMELRRE